jgi:hypothetical protein
MSYYDSNDDDQPVGINTFNRDLGRHIYKAALGHRRGFRNDQIGIDDPEMWAEIFEEMGAVAREFLEDVPR